MRGQFENKRRYLCSIPILLLLLCGRGGIAMQEHGRGASGNLIAQVSDFDNHDEPLIPTLLRIAAEYDLPMGIERVVKEGLERPVRVKLRRGTVADLLDLCIRQVPGYMWAVHGNVVHVYGDEEWRQPSNMLNLTLPSFEIHDETLGEADRRLRIKLLLQKGRLGGIAGVHGVTLELEQKRLRLKVQNATVRDILNHLTVLHGGVIWIARVSPERLSEIPQRGLWLFLPRSFFRQRSFRSVEYLRQLIEIPP